MLVAFLLLLTVGDAACNVTIEHSFRPIGSIATGVSWGHLYASMNFTHLAGSFRGFWLHFDQLLSKADPQEKKLLESLLPQLKVSKGALADIRTQFFLKEGPDHSRDKRQVLGAIAIGISIMNTAAIVGLQYEVTNMMDGVTSTFREVTHVIQEEDHAITLMAKDVTDMKLALTHMLKDARDDHQEVRAVTRTVEMMAKLYALDSQVATWGRGVDSLENGRLHPAMVTNRKLRLALTKLEEKAQDKGLRLLHPELTHLFKDPISYFTTTDGILHMFVHVPLTERDPMTLFEHVPLPHKIGDLHMTVEGTKTILATAGPGQQGLELRQADLLTCRSEDQKVGKMYVCPAMNILINNISSTCLGGMMYGQKEVVLKKCKFFPVLPDEEEFVTQTSANQATYFAMKEEQIVEDCPLSLRNLSGFVGLKELTADPGCRLISSEHTFTVPSIINEETDFTKSVMEVSFEEVYTDRIDEDLEKMQKLVDKIKVPAKIDLSRLELAMKRMEWENMLSKAGFGFSLTTVGIALMVLGILGYLFVRYRRNAAAQKRRREEKAARRNPQP